MSELETAVLELHRAHLAAEQQWSELMTTLALAAERYPTKSGCLDLIAHAADLAYELTGSVPDTLDQLLRGMCAEEQVRSAGRGRDHVRLLSTEEKPAR